MSDSPQVSVVLPIYNVAAHIEATINSILRQSFTDFELLVFDDCSTDGTAAVVERLAATDNRLRFFRNPQNLGRAGTDNLALTYATGEFIAKMDGDDLCHPERLAQQVAYLKQHPDINVVGSWMQNFGSSTYLNRYPTHPDDAQVLTLFTLPTGNPSVMLRASLFREKGMHYDAALRQSEDFDFFGRYIRELRIATLPKALIQYRVPPDEHKKDILSERATAADEVRERLLIDWQLPFTPHELRVYNLGIMGPAIHKFTLAEVEAWLQKLLIHNNQHPLFEPAALRRGLGERWFEVCYKYPGRRLAAVRQYYRSSLATYWQPSAQQQLKFGLQAVRNF
jgi:glycosyltransferase involved in cell wall biosynthesis